MVKNEPIEILNIEASYFLALWQEKQKHRMLKYNSARLE